MAIFHEWCELDRVLENAPPVVQFLAWFVYKAWWLLIWRSDRSHLVDELQEMLISFNISRRPVQLRLELSRDAIASAENILHDAGIRRLDVGQLVDDAARAIVQLEEADRHVEAIQEWMVALADSALSSRSGGLPFEWDKLERLTARLLLALLCCHVAPSAGWSIKGVTARKKRKRKPADSLS